MLKSLINWCLKKIDLKKSDTIVLLKGLLFLKKIVYASHALFLNMILKIV